MQLLLRKFIQGPHKAGLPYDAGYFLPGETAAPHLLVNIGEVSFLLLLGNSLCHPTALRAFRGFRVMRQRRAPGSPRCSKQDPRGCGLRRAVHLLLRIFIEGTHEAGLADNEWDILIPEPAAAQLPANTGEISFLPHFRNSHAHYPQSQAPGQSLRVFRKISAGASLP